MEYKLFLTNIQNAYSHYFNTKNSRKGPLWQSRFLASRIVSEEIFIHVLRYILLNPVTAYLIEIENLKDYPWIPFSDYVNGENYKFVDTEKALSIIGGKERLFEFVTNQADYQRRLSLIKKYRLD